MRRRQSPSKSNNNNKRCDNTNIKKRSEHPSSSFNNNNKNNKRQKRCNSKNNRNKKKSIEKKKKNLWLDIPDDVLLRIVWLCTRNPDDLFGLEVSCRHLRTSILHCWKLLAKEYYNIDTSDDDENNHTMTTGKDAWKEGRALRSLDVARCEYVYFRNADYGVFRDGVFFGCNESIMIMSSSGHDTLQDSSGFVPENPIRVRDATTLKIIANMEGTPNHKAVDLLGPSGNEFIMEYLDSGLRAHRNNKQIWEHVWEGDSSTTTTNAVVTPTDQWCMLPSHLALLMIRNQHLHLFVYTPSSPKLTDKVVIETKNDTPTMNWAILGKTFVLHVTPGVLTFWRITSSSQKMKKYKTTKLKGIQKCFDFIYAGPKHLVATGAARDDSSSSNNNDNVLFDDNIYVFNTDGILLHKLLETDVTRPRPTHYFSPMNAVNVIGSELLISNSLMGAALCVWNLRTGKLVHRQEQAIAEGHMFRPGDEFADGTWIHCLDQLPSFDFPMYLMADTGGSLFAWGFPETPEQQTRMANLKELAENENTR